MSLPSRERGLKYPQIQGIYHLICVAPFAGAWIEIVSLEPRTGIRARRSLRGSVD